MKGSVRKQVKQKSMGVAAVVVAMLALAGSALAAKGNGSLVAVYGGTAGQSNTQVKSAPTHVAAPAHVAAAATSTKATLPFTGMDLGVVVAGGLVFVLLGLALRRTARRTS